MNNFKKTFNKISISNKLVFYFLAIFSLFSLLLYFIIPVILNYPPGTINTSFDKELSFLYYKYQFLIAIFVIGFSFVLYLKITLKDIDYWWKTRDTNINLIKKVRKKALTFPYFLYVFMEIFPTIVVLLTLLFTNSHPPILLFKIGTIIFSFSTFIASICLILNNKTLYPLLVETSKYFNDNLNDEKTSLKIKLIFQLFPIILVIALILSLVGYYRLTLEKGSLLNNYYMSYLQSKLNDISLDPSIDNIDRLLSPYYKEKSTFSFVEKPDGSIETSNNSQLGHFFIKYMHSLAKEHNNTVYETYTIDSQAVIQEVVYNGEVYTVGIYFEIESFNTFLLLLILAFILFLFALFTISYIISSLVTNIRNVSTGLKNIATNDISSNIKLPITSNDELGELERELNIVQDLNLNYIKQIQNNQDMLMEKERLASLGQLIGGISHNLKTPIMSISGAAEGLTDLINEYDASIGDSDVTNEDHHAIANDMKEWITKLHSYAEYMSDIITAVKGQAVNLSENEKNEFTIEELFKRVNILMKHEIKKASLTLDFKLEVSYNTTLRGDINSLVQVINNLITNAIQAYNGKTGELISLIAKKEKNNLIISVSDNGCGMPDDVKEKLFKTMITTKGKNGTGLGMFMSYSTIKGHFNGDITFKSEINKGTTFNILLPLSVN